MNIMYVVVLIRVLFVLAMISVLVIEGALLARRERRLASTPDGDTPRNRTAGSAVVQWNLGYRAAGERQESNDVGAHVPGVQSRAA